MIAAISRSEIKGETVAPSSKSYTIRGLVCAALARGRSEVVNPLASDDTEACSGILDKIGVGLIPRTGLWIVSGGHFRAPETGLYCHESAATLRFMTSVCSVVPGECRLIPAPGLSARPLEPLLDALRQLGVHCHHGPEGVVVRGGTLKGGLTELPGNISSQFVSALLLIAPFAPEKVTIRLTTALESKSYVQMTLECLEKFGIRVESSNDLTAFKIARQVYRTTRYEVEGDWSSASYLLASGALCGEIEVKNLNPQSIQGDKTILDLLVRMGASVTVKTSSILVRRARLGAIKADLNECIDLLPTVAVLAACAEGVSEFTGIERARLKESDRVAAVAEGLQRMGIRTSVAQNSLTIFGGKPTGATIDSKDDHRIAMAFGLLGMVAGGAIINGAECVSKTYPDFWDVLKKIGAEVRLNG